MAIRAEKKDHSNPVSPQFYRSLLQFSLHSFCFFSLSLFLSLPTTVLSLLHVHASIVRKLDRGKAFETGKKEKENEKGFSRLRIALLRGEIKTPRRRPRVEERRRERIFLIHQGEKADDFAMLGKNMEQISGEIEYEMMILHFDSRSHFRALACYLREELGKGGRRRRRKKNNNTAK